MVSIGDIGGLVTSDQTVNILVILGVAIGGLKWIDRHYQKKLEDAEKAHEDDIKTVHKVIEDKFAEMMRYYTNLNNIIMGLFAPKLSIKDMIKKLGDNDQQ